VFCQILRVVASPRLNLIWRSIPQSRLLSERTRQIWNRPHIPTSITDFS